MKANNMFFKFCGYTLPDSLRMSDLSCISSLDQCSIPLCAVIYILLIVSIH